MRVCLCASLAVQGNEVIHHPDVQAVWVCSPSQFHADQIKTSAKAGKHIFCEKPIATDLAGTIEAVQVNSSLRDEQQNPLSKNQSLLCTEEVGKKHVVIECVSLHERIIAEDAEPRYGLRKETRNSIIQHLSCRRRNGGADTHEMVGRYGVGWRHPSPEMCDK